MCPRFFGASPCANRINGILDSVGRLDIQASEQRIGPTLDPLPKSIQLHRFGHTDPSAVQHQLLHSVGGLELREIHRMRDGSEFFFGEIRVSSAAMEAMTRVSICETKTSSSTPK